MGQDIENSGNDRVHSRSLNLNVAPYIGKVLSMNYNLRIDNGDLGAMQWYVFPDIFGVDYSIWTCNLKI